MPLLKFLFQVGDAVAFADQKYKKVIDQIRGLVDHPFIIPFHGLDDGLDGLLADLLCHSRDPGLEQGCGVGLLRHPLVTAFDHAFKLADKTETGRHGVPPTGLRAFVADRPVRNGADKKGVRIAVYRNGDKMKEVAAGLPFCP